MKCRNCGLPKSEHVQILGEIGSRKVLECPNGSGTTFPNTGDAKVELHYEAGEDYPWIANWIHPTLGAGEVVSARAADALELAGRRIEKAFEEKSDDDAILAQAIEDKPQSK
jgi:hypothetical protein